MNWRPNVVGGVDTPKRLFHGTSLDNARSIVRTGLIPYTPPNHGMIEIEPPTGVYLTPSWWAAQTIAQGHGDDGLVLVVKVRDLPLVHVQGWGGLTVRTYVSLEMIDAQRVVQARDLDYRKVWWRT